jgi:hypothetical protein
VCWHFEEDGALLVSPTREKLEPVVPRRKEEDSSNKSPSKGSPKSSPRSGNTIASTCLIPPLIFQYQPSPPRKIHSKMGIAFHLFNDNFPSRDWTKEMSQESACGDEQLCNRLDIRACLAYVAGAFLLLLRVSLYLSHYSLKKMHVYIIITLFIWLFLFKLL